MATQAKTPAFLIGTETDEDAMVKIALDPAMYHARMSVADELRKAADLGYEYVELSPRADWFFWHRYPKADDAMAAEVNQVVTETGVRIPSLVPVFGWSAPDEQERQAQVRNWKRLLEIADGLECPVIMTELSGDPIPSPHCHVDLLLSSEQARRDYLEVFASRDMELTGLNCNGNPLNPLPGVGPKHAEDLRRTIELAGLLGVRNVVTMSGTPGSDPDAKYPSWVVNPWDGVYMDVLDYQWGVASEFWKEIDALARASDVRVAIEMHPHNLVFSPVTLRKLVDLIGATNVGAEMDPSHLMWQGMDVVACIGSLGPLVFHAAANDAMITPGVGIRGVLDTSFERVPEDAPGKVPTGIGFWCNAWPTDPAWRFVAVGIGHDVAYWAEFLTALAAVNPGIAVNIEHEDADYSRLDGLALAAENLMAAAKAAGV